MQLQPGLGLLPLALFRPRVAASPTRRACVQDVPPAFGTGYRHGTILVLRRRVQPPFLEHQLTLFPRRCMPYLLPATQRHGNGLVRCTAPRHCRALAQKTRKMSRAPPPARWRAQQASRRVARPSSLTHGSARGVARRSYLTSFSRRLHPPHFLSCLHLPLHPTRHPSEGLEHPYFLSSPQCAQPHWHRWTADEVA